MSDWKTTDDYLYATGKYNAAIGQTVADADLTDTAVAGGVIDLTKRGGFTSDFKFDGNNATDDLVYELYRSTSDTFDGDEILIDTKTVSSDGSEDIDSYVITRAQYGAGYYLFKYKSSSTNTTFDLLHSGRYWD